MRIEGAGIYIQEEIEASTGLLRRVFDGMFRSCFNEIKNYATNVNEYIYFFSFLYQHYIEPLKGLHGKDLEERL